MARKVSSRSILNLCKNWGSKRSSEAIIRNLIKSLANDGERVIKAAYESRNWKNRLNNLQDSYVSAVFYNGKLQKETVRYVNDEPQSKRGRDYGWISDNVGDMYLTGRGEAANFLASYQLRHNFEKGIRLVVVAAMFYASLLENKGYQVLSQIDYQLMRLRNKKYKVRVAYYAGGHIDYEVPEVFFEVKRTRRASYGANSFAGFSKSKNVFG